MICDCHRQLYISAYLEQFHCVSADVICVKCYQISADTCESLFTLHSRKHLNKYSCVVQLRLINQVREIGIKCL